MTAKLAALILLSGLLAVGCGKSRPEAGTGTDGAKNAKTVLTFWHIMNYPGPKEALDAAVARFEKANPDVSVEVRILENDAYKTKLAVEMAGGTPPDILFTWGGGPLRELAATGRVIDLTDALQEDGWRERFIDRALDICTVDGKVHAVPLDLSAVVLWYNRDLFAEAGLAPPATLDDLRRVCAEFRKKGVTPLALGNLKQWPGAFYFAYLAARRGGVPLFLDAAAGTNGARLDDPAFVRAGQDLRSLIDADVFPVGFNGIDVGPARSMFLEGKAAMYLMGTWAVARVLADKPEFLDKLDCAPFPATPGGKGDPTDVVGGVNCGFAVSSSCRSPEKAIELLRFLTAPEVVTDWCATGRIPALQARAEDEAVLPEPTRKALSLLKNAAHMQPYYDQYLAPRVAAEHKKTTQGIFAGTMTPEAAARAMASAAGETP